MPECPVCKKKENICRISVCDLPAMVKNEVNNTSFNGYNVHLLNPEESETRYYKVGRFLCIDCGSVFEKMEPEDLERYKKDRDNFVE